MNTYILKFYPMLSLTIMSLTVVKNNCDGSCYHTSINRIYSSILILIMTPYLSICISSRQKYLFRITSIGHISLIYSCLANEFSNCVIIKN